MSSRKKVFNLKAYQELFTDAFRSGLAKASDRFYRMAGSPDMNKMMIGTRTALHYAAMKGNLDLVEFCLARGANPDIAAPNKSNPLTDACMNGHYKVARSLVAAGADVNHRALHGETPFMLTVQKYLKNRREIDTDAWNFMRELVRSGADSEIGHYTGARPVHAARNYRNKRMLNYLNEGLELHIDRYINIAQTQDKPRKGMRVDRSKILTLAVARGELDVLVQRMIDRKIGFVLSDFSEPISEKYSSIDAILKTDQIDCLMNTALWRDNSKDLFRLISFVPDTYTAKSDLMNLYNDVQRLNVSRSQSRNKRPKLG